MKLTYADVLTTLPVDATLQDYLSRCAKLSQLTNPCSVQQMPGPW